MTENKKVVVDKKNINNDEQIVHDNIRSEHPHRGYGLVYDRREEAGYNISWGAIFAGVVTFLAVLATLGTITTAVGLGAVDFTAADPFSGVVGGVSVVSVIAFILAFFAGGFVAGVASRRLGMLHGAVTWATSILAGILLLSYLASSLAGLAGKAVSTTAEVAGNVVGTTAEITGDAISTTVNAASEALGSADIDTKQIEDNFEKYLRDTDIPELQPEYLNNKLQESKDIVAQAGKDILVDPDNADKIAGEAADKIATISKEIAEATDKEAIVNSLEANSDYTHEEAVQVADNIEEGIQTASLKTQEMLTNAENSLRETVPEVKEQVEETKEEVAETATDATNTGATTSVIAFIGLLLGLVISTLAGKFGSNWVKDRYNEEDL